MSTHLRRLSLAGLQALALLTTTGCGGGAKAPSSPEASAPEQGASGQSPLEAALAARIAKDKAPKAIITYAIFQESPAPEDIQGASEALTEKARSWLTSGEGQWAGLDGVSEDVTVIHAAIEALPFNLEALLATAGPHRQAIAGAGSVYFVRYQGPPDPEDAQVKAAAAVASALAAEEAAPITDLSTLETTGAKDWAAQIASDDWRRHQIALSAELGPDGLGVLRTRGMAKFGLPDLEKSGVPQEKARVAFEQFQQIYLALKAHGPAAPGDTLAGVTLKPCVGAAQDYDRACVAY